MILPICSCCDYYDSHVPSCPARMQYERMQAEVARLREVEHEMRATIYAKEAEAQKWANEVERLRKAIVEFDAADPNDIAVWQEKRDRLEEIAREGK